MNPYTSKPYSQNYYEILKIRKALPVYGYKEEFLEILDKNKCVIVTSETGSGKSTQIPQWCLEYSEKYNQNKKIVCTQPRVFAATALAHRVAKEIDVEVGTVIGYHVRFNKSFNNSTRLIYMTSGVLLNKLTSDISANDYHIIIVDEAHERQIESDTLLGLLVYALRSRDNLKVIIMSATIEAEKFQKLFDNAPILQMPGKTYPVEIVYYDQCKSTDDYLLNNGIYEILEIVSKLVCEIHSNPLKKGDILVFLTGKDDIIKTEHMISSSLINKKDYIILHAHAELNLLELRKIHQKSTKRKIILATNMAQTSLTIDNIVFIIDCGFVKESHWNYKQRINELPIIRISKACAKQRAGRTGRVCPGICYRLYSKEVFNEMNESPKCQLECANIESLFLRMKRIVNVDFLFFEFIDPIPQEKLSKTFESLHYYGALQLNEEITELGLQINAFPLEPCHAIILIKSFTYNCYDSIIPIIAMLQKENIFIRPTTQNTALYEKSKKKFHNKNNDFLSLLEIFNQFNDTPIDDREKWCHDNFLNIYSLNYIMNMYEKLLEVSNRLGLKKLILHDKNDNKDYVKKVLTSGFFMQAAKLYGNQYMTILGGDKKLMSLDSDNISMDEKPEWIIYSKCIQTRNKYTLLNVTSIDPQSLVERNLSFFTRLIKMNKHDDNNNPAITDLENIQLKIKELSDGW